MIVLVVACVWSRFCLASVWRCMSHTEGPGGHRLEVQNPSSLSAPCQGRFYGGSLSRVPLTMGVCCRFPSLVGSFGFPSTRGLSVFLRGFFPCSLGTSI